MTLDPARRLHHASSRLTGEGKDMVPERPPCDVIMLERGLHELLNSQATDRFEFRSTWREKRSNVSHRGLAEEAAVFAIELRSAFVANLEGCTSGIETIVQHQAPRQLKPQLFLIL